MHPGCRRIDGDGVAGAGVGGEGGLEILHARAGSEPARSEGLHDGLDLTLADVRLVVRQEVLVRVHGIMVARTMGSRARCNL